MNMSIRQFFFQLSSGCSTFPIHWGSHIHLKCFLNKFPNGTWPMSWTVRLTRLKSTWSQYVLLFKWTMTIPLLSTGWESEMQLIPILSVGTLHTRPFIWDGLPFGITEAFLNKILLEIRILLNWRKLKSPTDKKWYELIAWQVWKAWQDFSFLKKIAEFLSYERLQTAHP